MMVQAENVLHPSVMLQASQLLQVSQMKCLQHYENLFFSSAAQELGNLTVEACDQQQLYKTPLFCDAKTPGDLKEETPGDLKEVTCPPCDDQPARFADTLARGGGGGNVFGWSRSAF